MKGAVEERYYFRSSEVVCGRLTCRRCRKWRHTSYYSVASWGDKRKIRPSAFRSSCETCARVYKATRARISERKHAEALRKQQDRERRRVDDLRALEVRHVRSILASVPKEVFLQYELEGVLPITFAGAEVSDEDLDPTPIPEGCPRCWRRGGEPCTRCPDPDAARKCLSDRRSGLVLSS